MLEGTSTGACRRIVSGLSPTTECNAVSYGSSLCVFFLPHQSFFNHSSLILSAAQTTVNHGLCPETHFSFDRPFPSPLDGTSLVSIMPFVGHMAFNGNDYSDGEPPQSVAVSTLSWTPFAQLIAACSPAVNARQSEVPLSHFPVTQSPSPVQADPIPHRCSQVVPPQSTPVSVPSVAPFVQDVHTEPSHCVLPQSASKTHAFPSAHALQTDPPQSVSVSSPF